MTVAFRWRRIAVALYALVSYASCTMETVRPAVPPGTYRGTVVDDETGTPIAGASVVVVWYAGGYFKLDNWVLPDARLHGDPVSIPDR